MLTTTCTLTFADGKIVTGKVTVQTPYDERTVIYQGATDRLPRRYEKATPAQLRNLFLTLHTETGGTYSSTDQGEYDQAE